MALAAAACDRAAAPAPGGAAFTYAATDDLSGYYRPLTPVHVGDWSLDSLFLGQPAAFRGYDGGTAGPVTMRFVPASGSGPEVRVLPTQYSVTDAAVRFEGRSPELGRVAFDGRLDQGALATARRNLGGDGAVLIGTLTASGETVGAVRLSWWMGD